MIVLYRFSHCRDVLDVEEYFLSPLLFSLHNFSCFKLFHRTNHNHILIIYLLGVQIRFRFLKDGSNYCERFIVIADFGGFREVKHLLIIFSLYRFEFHTKILIFTVFEMSNFVNQAAFTGGFDFL